MTSRRESDGTSCSEGTDDDPGGVQRHGSRRDRSAHRRARRPGAPRTAAGGGHAHRRSRHRRGAGLHRCPERLDGRQHRGGRADGAGRLPQAGRRQSRRGPEHTARSDAGGGLRPGSRRGPERPLDGRPAGGLPGRRPGRLAGAGLVGDAGRDRGGHDGAVRRAGLRLHRRAVRGQRRGSHRRALDERPGPRALPGAAGSAAARRCGARRPGRRGRTRRLGRAHHVDGGPAAGRPGARCARVARARSPAGRRGPAGRGGR